MISVVKEFPNLRITLFAEDRLMGSFTQLNYHVVFATKFRNRVLARSNDSLLYNYIGGIVGGFSGVLDSGGGVEDHVHLLVNIPAKIAVSDAIRSIKSNSSRWLNEQTWNTKDFEWQKGYGAFTVSFSQMDRVRSYIANQEEHHQRLSFQQEYINLLKKHDIDFDLRYLFEDEHHG